MPICCDQLPDIDYSLCEDVDAAEVEWDCCRKLAEEERRLKDRKEREAKERDRRWRERTRRRSDQRRQEAQERERLMREELGREAARQQRETYERAYAEALKKLVDERRARQAAEKSVEDWQKQISDWWRRQQQEIMQQAKSAKQRKKPVGLGEIATRAAGGALQRMVMGYVTSQIKEAVEDRDLLSDEGPDDESDLDIVKLCCIGAQKLIGSWPKIFKR